MQQNDMQQNDMQENDMQQNNMQQNDIQQNNLYQNDMQKNDMEQKCIKVVTTQQWVNYETQFTEISLNRLINGTYRLSCYEC